MTSLLKQNQIANQNCPCDVIKYERAHIINFSNLVANQDYQVAIDPFNCLLLCPNCHKQFDHPETHQNQPIKIQANLHPDQKKYLELANKYYQMVTNPTKSNRLQAFHSKKW